MSVYEELTKKTMNEFDVTSAERPEDEKDFYSWGGPLGTKDKTSSYYATRKWKKIKPRAYWKARPAEMAARKKLRDPKSRKVPAASKREGTEYEGPSLREKLQYLLREQPQSRAADLIRTMHRVGRPRTKQQREVDVQRHRTERDDIPGGGSSETNYPRGTRRYPGTKRGR